MNKKPTLTTVRVYCQEVLAGKPAASISMKRSHSVDATAMCRVMGCKYYLTPPKENIVTLYIYLEEFMLDVIKASLDMADDSAVNIWFKGCMYGYSLEKIKEMVNKIVYG